MAIYDKDGNQLSACYDANGNALQNAYDVSGNVIFTAQTHAVSNNFTKTLLYNLSDINAGTQGLAGDSLSRTLAQLYGGKMYLIDIDTGAYEQVGSAFNMIHGGSGQFKPTKENAEDDYPLLYVSGGMTVEIDGIEYDFLLEISITGTTPTRVRAFKVPSPHGGDGGGFAIDFANNIAYHIASDAYTGGTVTTVTAYDMTQLTATDDYPTLATTNGTYVFNTVLDTFTIDYVTNNQSVTFFDGLIVLLSDGSRKYIRFIDPTTHNVYLDITDMPSGENEGVTFVLDEDGVKYDMYVCSRYTGHGDYVKYVFNL